MSKERSARLTQTEALFHDWLDECNDIQDFKDILSVLIAAFVALLERSAQRTPRAPFVLALSFLDYAQQELAESEGKWAARKDLEGITKAMVIAMIRATFGQAAAVMKKQDNVFEEQLKAFVIRAEKNTTDGN
jgi:hypothetical protein